MRDNLTKVTTKAPTQMSKFLFGSGGHSKVLIDIAQASQTEIAALFDDNSKLWGTDFHSLPVLGGKDKIDLNSQIFISIGANHIRRKIALHFQGQGHSFFSLLHPSAQISPSADIAEGTCVMPGAIINADVRIGAHCIINTAATVDHDCVIEDFVHIAPGVNLCGNISIGEGSIIGVGASIIPGIKIGKNCTICAGAVVLRNVPDGSKVIGNPGRII